MAVSRDDVEQGLMPSVLDRLIDPDSAGTRARPWYSVNDMVQAVRRDLEDLLNARASGVEVPAQFGEVRRSIAAYGLPDLTSLNALTPQQRVAIGRTLEAAITTFEPRLRDVRARLVETTENKEQSVRFHIDARLALDPAPPVALEAVLELGSGHYSVQASGA